MSVTATAVTAAAAAPAGGSPVEQVVIATAGATVVIAVLLAVGMRRRAGRSFAWLDLAERLASQGAGGIPGWAALPVALGAGSLVAALFGLQWDVSLHADKGRDAGPLANPSHYFILLGLLGIFAAGWLAVVLPRERPGPVAVRIGRDWHAPVGGLAMMGTSGFALMGFPLDDVWHRLFGQDVTLWGPTHLIMLTGAAFTLVGMGILLVEGDRARRAAAGTAAARPWHWPLAAQRVKLVLLCGGLLAGISIYQDEFDYGIAQYRLLFHPAMIALAGALVLVAARLLAGRGGALGAVAFFLVLRGTLTFLVGPVLGETTGHFPLYVAEALLVEAAALVVGTARVRRFGLVSGVLIGTVGTVAELGWSHVWMPVAWPLHLLPSAILVAVPVALAGAVMGAFLAGALRGRLAGDGWRAVGGAVLAACVAAAVFAALLPTSVPDARARVQLRPAGSTEGGRLVDAIVRVTPADALRDPDWLRTIAWQGGGHVEGAPLRRTGPGTYQTTEPIPVGGTWKTAIRFHRGSEMASVVVFLPDDPAIAGAREVPAAATFTRPFTADHEILQRERTSGATGVLWTAAILVVMGIVATLLAGLGVALVRVSRGGREVVPAAPPAPPAPRMRPRRPAEVA
jgi:hypothetical protein